MRTIIVEVSGGVVQQVYTDANDVRIILVDWDKGDSPGDEYAGGDLQPALFSDMPKETLSAVFTMTLPERSAV